MVAAALVRTAIGNALMGCIISQARHMENNQNRQSTVAENEMTPVGSARFSGLQRRVGA
jgi:hypothetical protein